MDALSLSRQLLAELTPLHSDCGLYCGGVCCRSHEGEDTGMLLFPGEERFYEGQPQWRILPAEGGKLILCGGECQRENRPLSCRIFPLLPILREDGVHVVTDARAAGTCPLKRDDLSPEFVAAVKQVGELLAQDPEQAAFLARLTAIHDELKALRRRFSGR